MRRWSVWRWPVVGDAISDKNRIRPAARQRGEQFLVRPRLAEILLQDGYARNRIEGKNIERHDRAPALGRVNTLCRDLAPAAWSRTKIDNDVAGLQEPIFVRDFLKLVGRTAAIAFALRGSHVRVVQLPLEPMPGRGRAAAGLLQLDLKRPIQIWLSLGHE